MLSNTSTFFSSYVEALTDYAAAAVRRKGLANANEDAAPLNRLRQNLPLELEHVITKSLQKDRELRFRPDTCSRFPEACRKHMGRMCWSSEGRVRRDVVLAKDYVGKRGFVFQMSGDEPDD